MVPSSCAGRCLGVPESSLSQVPGADPLHAALQVKQSCDGLFEALLILLILTLLLQLLQKHIGGGAMRITCAGILQSSQQAVFEVLIDRINHNKTKTNNQNLKLNSSRPTKEAPVFQIRTKPRTSDLFKNNLQNMTGGISRIKLELGQKRLQPFSREPWLRRALKHQQQNPGAPLFYCSFSVCSRTGKPGEVLHSRITHLMVKNCTDKSSHTQSAHTHKHTVMDSWNCLF